MPTDKFHFPENLTIIMANVTAVREVHKYLRGDGLSADWRLVHERLRQEVVRKYPSLRLWDYTQPEDCDSLWKASNWRGIGLGLYTPSPVKEDDPDAYAYLYVPKDYPKKRRLSARLLELQGKRHRFEHHEDPKHEGYDEVNPVWIWVRYSDFVKRGRRFDWTGFMEVLVKRIGVLYALQPEIEKVVNAPRKLKR